MTRLGILCFILAVLVLAPIVVSAQPTITIHTDHDAYQPGDTIEVSLSGENYDEAVFVDVYVGLLTPDGSVYSYSHFGWFFFILPWIESIQVPSSFSMQQTPFWSIGLPCSMPPIRDEGQYNFAALLTYPGTFDRASELSLALFSVLREEPATDVTMISIPEGSFLMGSPVDEEGRYENEGPQRTVNVSAFWMSETEVTEKQWEDVMGWNHCYRKRGDNYPVEYVTWYDCVSFCNELSEAHGFAKCYFIFGKSYDGNHITLARVHHDPDGDGYRLPTEAEWEYACRAGTTTRFHTGDSASDLSRAGWYYGNSGSQKQEVGQKQANAWGLHDMHGNVHEWIWDWYSSYDGARADSDTRLVGNDDGSHRVSRGGGWFSSARGCRSAYRGDGPNYRGYDLGFRIVRSVN